MDYQKYMPNPPFNNYLENIILTNMAHASPNIVPIDDSDANLIKLMSFLESIK